MSRVAVPGQGLRRHVKRQIERDVQHVDAAVAEFRRKRIPDRRLAVHRRDGRFAEQGRQRLAVDLLVSGVEFVEPDRCRGDPRLGGVIGCGAPCQPDHAAAVTVKHG